MQNSTNGLKSVQRLAQSSSFNLQQSTDNLNLNFDDCLSNAIYKVLLLFIYYYFFYFKLKYFRHILFQ